MKWRHKTLSTKLKTKNFMWKHTKNKKENLFCFLILWTLFRLLLNDKWRSTTTNKNTFWPQARVLIWKILFVEIQTKDEILEQKSCRSIFFYFQYNLYDVNCKYKNKFYHRKGKPKTLASPNNAGNPKYIKARPTIMGTITIINIRIASISIMPSMAPKISVNGLIPRGSPPFTKCWLFNFVNFFIMSLLRLHMLCGFSWQNDVLN